MFCVVSQISSSTEVLGVADVIALGSIPIRMVTKDWVQEHIFIAAPNFYQRLLGLWPPLYDLCFTYHET